MKTVITYGTFDLLHTGHINLLKRARNLGERLIVGVTSDHYDKSRGKLNVIQTLSERMENVRETGLADLIIVEEMEGQKLLDIQQYGADIFVIGSDWREQFDFLKGYCQVIYLERTKGVSSTMLRQSHNQIIHMGVAGYGRIAGRFIPESKYVSGMEIISVYGPDGFKAESFAKQHELSRHDTDYDDFLQTLHAVYIAAPHHLHYELSKRALLQGKHVLCEKPLALHYGEAEELFQIAEANGCILLEAIKTAFAPAFQKLMEVAASGLIGSIKAVDATFTTLITDFSRREYDPLQAGGAFTELGTYPLFVIERLLGSEVRDLRFVTSRDGMTGVDVFTRAECLYAGATATATVAIGAKQEGDLCITGTKAYLYVPAPWWKTEQFEARFEDSSCNKKYFIKFDGDGLRYELAAFLHMIHKREHDAYVKATASSLFLASVQEQFREGINVVEIS